MGAQADGVRAGPTAGPGAQLPPTGGGVGTVPWQEGSRLLEAWVG